MNKKIWCITFITSLFFFSLFAFVEKKAAKKKKRNIILAVGNVDMSSSRRVAGKSIRKGY